MRIAEVRITMPYVPVRVNCRAASEAAGLGNEWGQQGAGLAPSWDDHVWLRNGWQEPWAMGGLWQQAMCAAVWWAAADAAQGTRSRWMGVRGWCDGRCAYLSRLRAAMA